MANKKASKLDELVAANNDRVKKVQELQDQMAQIREAVSVLKEEHDFTRGQITLLQEMEGSEDTK